MFLVKSDCEKLFVQVIDILQIDYFYHMWFYMFGLVYKTRQMMFRVSYNKGKIVLGFYSKYKEMLPGKCQGKIKFSPGQGILKKC